MPALARLRVLSTYSVPKSPDYVNEDCIALSNRLGTYVLSDGASVSFDSASWARIICVRYAQHPLIDDAWLTGAIGEYERRYNRDSLSWMAQGAFDRGSFASVLAVRYVVETERAEIFALGDSIAALCDGLTVVSTFPYTRSEQFLDAPELLSTHIVKNSFLRESGYPLSRSVSWALSELTEPRVLCMTDALGHWFILQQEAGADPVASLLDINSRYRFAAFVHRERSAGRMRRDDTTLVVLGRG